MSIQNYSLEEAAKILRCRLNYLKDNLSRLPHQKIGVAVAFDDDELLAIKEMHRVHPSERQSTPRQQPAPVPARPAPPVPPSLSGLRPSQKHGRRAG